jgi:hypothetical protein
MTVTAMLAALRMARRGRRATRRSPISADTGVGESADRAHPRRTDLGNERRCERDDERHAEGCCDRDERERRRSRSTDEIGLGIGEERGRTPAGQQADESRDERQEQVLGQEGRRDQVRRAADGLQQSDPPGTFRQAASDEDGHARQREQAEQRGAGQEHGLVAAQEAGVPVSDHGP